ncbi:MAG: 50S ribosomal protein L11 methyltransferase [Caldilineales bacterium]|nr:50S ribosomal protein L11 methyltransferase [Caldilineales bacterium]MDW8319554.1 50S ribosomal protein L11 methyltransferase [Anaerolineae bacterium]
MTSYRPAGYTILGYGRMVADRVRTDAYAEALRRAVRPGCTVLDIGTGPGIFALLACQAGAGHVYAVDPNPSIRLAQELALANGFADRITFLQDLSTNVTLPQRADVIVQDLHGLLPLFQRYIPTLMDARERHLAPGGVLIPRRETLWLAPVEAPQVYRQYAGPWDESPYGLDWGPAREVGLNAIGKAQVQPEQLVAPPQPWATLDYLTIASPDVVGDVQFAVQRPAVVHGLAAWFDAELVDGVGFSAAPGRPETIYGHTFFPWRQPTAVEPGDLIVATVQATLGGHDYLWTWSVRVLDQRRRVKTCYEHSTFFADHGNYELTGGSS